MFVLPCWRRHILQKVCVLAHVVTLVYIFAVPEPAVYGIAAVAVSCIAAAWLSHLLQSALFKLGCMHA